MNATSINASKTLTVGAMTDAAAETILNSNINVGGRNLLLQSDYASSFTQNGITFTNNGDGSVTANGTATGLATFPFAPHVTLDSGTYTLSGCPPTGSDSTYRLDILDVPTSTGVTNREDYGEGRTFETVGGTTNAVRLHVASGATVNNVTVYPKLEKGNIATDWTPAPEDTDNAIINVASDISESLENMDEALNDFANTLEEQSTDIGESINKVQDQLNALREDFESEVNAREQ